MEFTTASKVALGTLLLGVAGYLGKEYVLGYSIADLIKQKNPERKLISSTVSLYGEKWKKAWNKYLEDNKNKEKDAWGLPDWNVKLVSSKNNESVPTSFIDACDNFSQTSVISTSNHRYKEVLEWCTSSSAQKISELIKEQGKRVLNESDSKDNANSGWKAALNKYLNVSNNPLGIERNSQPANDDAVMNSFVKKCTELAEKVDGIKEDDISRVVDHCSVARTIKDLIGDERPDVTFIDVNKIKPSYPVAIELWNKYLGSNKDKEEDDWNVGDWAGKKKTQKVAPDDFFKKCEDRSSKVALDIQPKIINELVRYCTHDSRVKVDYSESNSVTRS